MKPISEIMMYGVVGIFACLSTLSFIVSLKTNKSVKIKQNADHASKRHVHPSIGTLQEIRNTIQLSSVPIDRSGEAMDRYLVNKKVAESIITGVEISHHSKRYEINACMFKLLVFGSSVLYSRNGQMSDLLELCSKLNFSIHYVNDMGICTEEFMNRLTMSNLRCDRLINSKHTNVNELKKYNIIFHPYAGLSSSYETMVEIIRILKDEYMKKFDE